MVFLGEAIEQLNALLEHAVPAVALGVPQRLLLILRPLPVESHGRIFLAEVGPECLLEATAKEHGRAGVSLLPTIEIAVAITAWAAQIMAELRVAVSHDA